MGQASSLRLLVLMLWLLLGCLPRCCDVLFDLFFGQHGFLWSQSLRAAPNLVCKGLKPLLDITKVFPDHNITFRVFIKEWNEGGRHVGALPFLLARGSLLFVFFEASESLRLLTITAAVADYGSGLL